MERKKQINLQEILYALLGKIWLIVLCAAVMGSAVYFYTANFVTPLYRASIKIYVNNSVSEYRQEGVISSSDLATSQQLVNSYIIILEDYDVMDKVAQKVYATHGYRVSADQIRGMMSAGAVNETEIFAVNISHADPKVAKAVADAIADTAPEAISSIIKSSSAAIVSRARMPRAPYTPNTRQSAVYGTFIGVMLAVAYVMIRVLMDVRVKGEEDLALISDAPVLGIIPNFDAEERNSYSYQSSQPGNQSKAVEK